MNMLDFGVFYTCYTEISAVNHSIMVLRKIYPECPVFLISDGGSDYSHLENEYSGISALLEEDSRGFIPFLTQENFKTEENQLKILSSIRTFLGRIKRAIEHNKKDYTLIMEPDVLVRGKLSFPIDAHLLGSRINVDLSSELRKTVLSVKGAIDVNTWGATPALFRSDTFIEAYNVLMTTDNLLETLSYSDHRLANYDVLLAVLFALAGHHETFNPDIVECFREPMWRVTKHPLVHQYREYYPKSSSGYDGFHTKHKHGLGDKVA